MEIQIISLIIAFAAVIIGPLVTYRITKKNLEFQFRTMTQEKWIEKLESEVGNYLFSIVQWIEKYPGLVERGRKEMNQKNEINVEIDRMLDTINISTIKLDLILDLNDANQKVIVENVIKMKQIVNGKIYDKNSKADLMKSYTIIVEMSKTIFQNERKEIVKIYK